MVKAGSSRRGDDGVANAWSGTAAGFSSVPVCFLSRPRDKNRQESSSPKEWRKMRKRDGSRKKKTMGSNERKDESRVE